MNSSSARGKENAGFVHFRSNRYKLSAGWLLKVWFRHVWGWREGRQDREVLVLKLWILSQWLQFSSLRKVGALEQFQILRWSGLWRNVILDSAGSVWVGDMSAWRGHEGTQYLNWGQSQNKAESSTLFSEKEHKVNLPHVKKESESSVAFGFSQRKAVLAALASSLWGQVFSHLHSLLVRISDQGPGSIWSLHTKSLRDVTSAGQCNVQKWKWDSWVSSTTETS